MSYNGYVNYETWNVSLWLDNEQGSYNRYVNLAYDVLTRNDNDPDTSRYELGKIIAYDLENNNPLGDQASVYSDLLGASLRSVHWPDVAEGFVDLAMERIKENA